jgi:TolB-like protein
LGDERAGPKYIETVVRRGYRFVAPVIMIGPEERAPQGSPPAAESHKLVVAVLPLVNATGDAELEYLADGLTDNLINNLARVSQLRVMSHSAAFRYKRQEIDPQRVGKELHANAVLVGKVTARRVGIAISAELVDVSTGWQLWGESFDSANCDLLEIQDAITRHLLAALKLKLSGEEEQRVTARYTENAAAYQAYLEGRYHWSRYTRKGIEKAIKHFRHAIELDPNYALAYAAIVDCYLRLATNYLPPEDDRPASKQKTLSSEPSSMGPSQRVKLRFEWDWKCAERELRRALELKTNYPTAYQWYVAYQTSRQLYRECYSRGSTDSLRDESYLILAPQISDQLTPTEEVNILCSVARDQIAIGNYEAAHLILRRWSSTPKWPTLNSLNPYAAADLLFTVGTLLGCVAGTKQVIHGHRRAESFLSGAIALFEQLGAKTRSVEAQVELARCYHRQGLFDIACATLAEASSELPEDETELKNSCLALWGAVERQSGRFVDAVHKLREAATIAPAGHLYSARCYHELANALKDLAFSEGNGAYADEALAYYQKTLYVCEAVGNLRHAAGVENNFGLLLLNLGFLNESQSHLMRAKRLFDCLSDSIRGALVNETLTRLYLETKQYSLAQQAIEQAVETLERTDGEAHLAEALTTAGMVAARQGRYEDGKKGFQAAYMVAERCGDQEGAGLALLIMFEEMNSYLGNIEKNQISEKLKKLLSTTQQTALQARIQKCLEQTARGDS